MIFANPIILLLLPVIAAAFFIAKLVWKDRFIIFPTDRIIHNMPASLKPFLLKMLIYVRFAALLILVLALARPQMALDSRVRREGIAIVLALDCSSTMLAEDLQLGPLGLAKLVEDPSAPKRLNRLEAVRNVAKEFIKARPDDMIGVVAFAAQAYIVSPPTFDKDWLLSSLKRVNVGMIKDGTAIGSGILSSLEALKNVKAKSRVVILLSDGINNYGKVPPLVASEAARAFGIKIYTIGIAAKGQSPFPTTDVYGHKTYENIKIDMDENVLKKIADTTGGSFFRVTDIKSLESSYAAIDKLEKSEVEQGDYSDKEDLFQLLIVAALILLMIEIILGNSFLRRIP